MQEILKVNDKEVIAVERNGEIVITTAQLAEVYGTDVNNVQNNFNRNKERFDVGKHFYLLKGNELRAFKNQVTDSDLVNKHTTQVYLHQLWKVQQMQEDYLKE